MAAAITVESENQTISKREPPEVHVKVLELENLPSLSKPWKDIRNQYQPVDVLLLTVKDCEFLSCLSYLNEGFVKSNPPTLGTVYFGNIGDDEVVKVAVMKCDMGSSTPGGSLVVVPKAVRSLRPKAVFNVGFCASLNEEKAKLGDVVVCSKLITYAFITRTGNRIKERRVKVPLKRDLANLVKNIGDGWKPPLKNSTGQKVELRKDGVFLSDPEVVNNRKRRAELIKRYPEATAIEMEGEGLFVAAHDLNIEWIVIKGVSNLADGKKSETDHWRPFASLMAASLVAHTLKDAYVFESWPHFEDDSDTEGRRMPPSPSFPNPKRIKVAAENFERHYNGRWATKRPGPKQCHSENEENMEASYDTATEDDLLGKSEDNEQIPLYQMPSRTCPESLQYRARAKIRADEDFKNEIKQILNNAEQETVKAIMCFYEREIGRFNTEIKKRKRAKTAGTLNTKNCSYKSTPYGLLGDRTMARTVLSSSSSGDDSDEEIDTLGSRWSSIPFLGPGPKKRKEAADDPDEESSTPKKRRSLFSPSDPGPEKSKAKAGDSV
ncbi:5'-methylthioadenosine/S-adenosylhomocysteine nucleosidase [Stylophora pistillata]|uniref:5'-methylthioadenosine/S-adenosylhomocysteine nucleosidase n=1 Tax=Stylophora pistillata TaxID=50429 RepID=A0A2B4S997_STYPI|nr:5'-methylthioadenosine/S-adenosylhomocysteine nucleosidase [Stylophora pistillata]